MKKIITLFMAVLLTFSTAAFSVGCGSEEQFDETKTHIIVGLEESGYGRNWMDKIIEDFEKEYAEVSFEKDKKGVEIALRVKPDAYSSNSILSNIAYSEEDVYVINSLSYDEFVDRTTGESNLLLYNRCANRRRR